MRDIVPIKKPFKLITMILSESKGRNLSLCEDHDTGKKKQKY